MNNFDKSSTGLNIELICDRDFDLAVRDFKDEMNHLFKGYSLLNPRFSKVDVFTYVGGGNYVDPNDIENYTFTKDQIKTAILSFPDERDYSITFDESKRLYGKHFNKLNKSELTEFFVDRCEDLSDFAIEHLTPLFEVVPIRGHCQGDYQEIIVHKNDYYEDIYLYFTNLSYNAPLYLRLEIDGYEIYMDEELKNSYDFDENEIKGIIKKEISNYSEKEQTIIMDFVEENLSDI